MPDYTKWGPSHPDQFKEITNLLLLEMLRSQLKDALTKTDLDTFKQDITMKLSEIKTQLAATATRSTEGFAEITRRLEEIQAELATAIAAATDPEVTDEEFLADLQTVKGNVDALADIIPDVPVNPQPPVVNPETGTGISNPEQSLRNPGNVIGVPSAASDARALHGNPGPVTGGGFPSSQPGRAPQQNPRNPQQNPRHP